MQIEVEKKSRESAGQSHRWEIFSMMDTKDEKQMCVAHVMFETGNVQTEAQMIEISTMEDHLSPISLNHMKAKVYGYRDAVGLVHALIWHTGPGPQQVYVK